MTTSALPQSLSPGAQFLLADAAPAAVLTPEDATPDERQMVATAARFMDKEVLPRTEELERQEPGLARKLFAQAGELGLLGLEVPEAHGGLGLGKRAAIGVNQQLSRLAGFGITCGAHSGIGSQPITYFGTEAQKRSYLPRLATGEWMAAYCLSEAGSGSDALGLKTTATLTSDGKHYVLNGVKAWITNAAWADLFTVFAKVDSRHVTAFLVERGYAGVSTGREEHKLGIKSSSTRRVALDDVRVPVENVLGEVGKGAYVAFNNLNFGRYSLGAGLVGAARDQLRCAARYATERRQFGRPLADFGLVQQKLASMAAKVFAAESATHRTAGLIDDMLATGETLDIVTPPFPRALDEFALECSVVKVGCSEILFAVADEALQIHGGYGFTEEFTPARALRDARINRIFEGTNEINRLFIPTVLVRREQKGRFPLGDAVAAATAQIERGAARPVTTGDREEAPHLLADAKRLVFHLVGIASRQFGAKLVDEQEVLAALADIIGEIYFAESALLRAAKSRATGASALQQSLALLFLAESVERMQRSAREVLVGTVARGEFARRSEEAARLLAWCPDDLRARRRQVAREICAREASG